LVPRIVFWLHAFGVTRSTDTFDLTVKSRLVLYRPIGRTLTSYRELNIRIADRPSGG